MTPPRSSSRRPVSQAPILVGNVQGIGAREGQEDSFALVNASDPEADGRRGCLRGGGWDGGLADGKAISEAAVDGFLQLFQTLGETGDVPRQLLSGTCAINDALFQRFGGRSGTTAVAVWILRDRLHWISVGDSAIFLMRHGGVFQVNRNTRAQRALSRRTEPGAQRPARAESDEDARRLSAFLGMPELREADMDFDFDMEFGLNDEIGDGG